MWVCAGKFINIFHDISYKTNFGIKAIYITESNIKITVNNG